MERLAISYFPLKDLRYPSLHKIKFIGAETILYGKLLYCQNVENKQNNQLFFPKFNFFAPNRAVFFRSIQLYYLLLQAIFQEKCSWKNNQYDSKFTLFWRQAYIAECSTIDESGNICESAKISFSVNLVSLNPEFGSTLAERLNQKCFSALLQLVSLAAVFSVDTQRSFPRTAVFEGRVIS